MKISSVVNATSGKSAQQHAEADMRLKAAIEAYDLGDEGVPADEVFRRLRQQAATRKKAKECHTS